MKTGVLCLLFGYLIGTVNPAYMMSKMRGFDIREEGSGNAGASNVVLIMGKAKGTFCMMFDIIKAWFAYRIARIIFPMLHIAGILAGIGCIMGHIFPAWMGFRGGKGLACLAGTALGYNWRVFLVLLGIEVVIVLICDYICVVALSASVLFPLVYVWQMGDWIGYAGLLAVSVVMFYKHKENIMRIMEGKEVRVSYLWNKEKEKERLQEYYDV